MVGLCSRIDPPKGSTSTITGGFCILSVCQKPAVYTGRVTIISPEYRSALLDPEVARRIPGVKLPVDNQDAPRGVAWHYGDPLVEQRAPFVVDRSDRVVAKVSGSDRLSFLNNLLSQKLDDLVSSDNSDDDAWVQRREALNLDAQGRVLQHMTVWAVGDEVYVELSLIHI